MQGLGLNSDLLSQNPHHSKNPDDLCAHQKLLLRSKLEDTFLESPGGSAVRTQSFPCPDLGSVPGWGTKILKVMRLGQKANKQKDKILTAGLFLPHCISRADHNVWQIVDPR